MGATQCSCSGSPFVADESCKEITIDQDLHSAEPVVLCAGIQYEERVQSQPHMMQRRSFTRNSFETSKSKKVKKNIENKPLFYSAPPGLQWSKPVAPALNSSGFSSKKDLNVSVQVWDSTVPSMNSSWSKPEEAVDPVINSSGLSYWHWKSIEASQSLAKSDSWKAEPVTYSNSHYSDKHGKDLKSLDTVSEHTAVYSTGKSSRKGSKKHKWNPNAKPFISADSTISGSKNYFSRDA